LENRCAGSACSPAWGGNAGRIAAVELKITQFRLNLVYQFTQHLRIVKHLLTRADIIFRNSSATKALSHKGYNIFLLMPFLIRGTLKLIENQDAYRLALNGQVFVLSTPVASRLQL
jgi:hypothetical protein